MCSGHREVIVFFFLLAAALTPVGWRRAVAVGVNWGTSSSHPLSSPKVVSGLLQSNNITNVKLFDADPAVLESLSGSGIKMVVGIPNDMLASLNSSKKAAASWVHDNITRYFPNGGVEGGVRVEGRWRAGDRASAREGDGKESLLMVLLNRARMSLEFLVSLLLFVVLNPVTAGQSGGLCISPGGRFHPFSTEGKPPRKVSKGPRDLAICRVFRQNTCCDVAQTYRALEYVRRLASFGEASQECLHIWELLECSVCDPRIGVQPGPPLICASFCDMILRDCSSAYFSIDPRIKALSPCGLGDIICGRAGEWASNGTVLCRLAGFAVKQDVVSNHDVDGQYCYGGKASIESISGSWKASRSGLSVGDQSYGGFEDFQRWFRKFQANEKVKWAIGGIVLTSGLFYISKRTSYSQRQKQAAVIRMARKMEARINHQSSSIRR